MLARAVSAYLALPAFSGIAAASVTASARGAVAAVVAGDGDGAVDVVVAVAVAGPYKPGQFCAIAAPYSGLLTPWWQVAQATLGASPVGPRRLAGKAEPKGIR